MKIINKLGVGQIKEIIVSESGIDVRTLTEEYHYGRREGVETPGDELDEFSRLCRSKWCSGRKEYEGKNIPVYQADTIQELQNELLDASNFCAVFYWELERMKTKLNYKPEVRE